MTIAHWTRAYARCTSRAQKRVVARAQANTDFIFHAHFALNLVALSINRRARGSICQDTPLCIGDVAVGMVHTGIAPTHNTATSENLQPGSCCCAVVTVHGAVVSDDSAVAAVHDTVVGAHRAMVSEHDTAISVHNASVPIHSTPLSVNSCAVTVYSTPLADNICVLAANGGRVAIDVHVCERGESGI